MIMPTLPSSLLAWSEQVFVLTAAGALAALTITHPKARLLLWQGLLLLMLLLPLVEPWKTPPVEVSSTAVVIAGAGPSVPIAAPVTPKFQWRSLHWRAEDWLWLIGAGAALRLLWVGAGFFRLRRYRRQARLLAEPPLRFASDVASWYASDSVPGPVTYGWRRPVILLPARTLELPGDLIEAIECHELIHVHRGDWLWVLAETLVRSLLWFHPAVWFVLGRIQLAREQVVDQAAVKLLRNRDRYLDALVAVAEYQLQPDLAPAPLFLRKRHLVARVESVIKEIDMSRSRMLAGVTAVCSVLPIAAFTAMSLFPFMSEAQTAPDSPGITVNAGAVLVHRAPVRAPESSTSGGTVIVQATMDAQGEVTDAQVVSGPQELRKEALTSVLQWHYRPGPTTAQISIQFAASQVAAAARTAVGVAVPSVGFTSPAPVRVAPQVAAAQPSDGRLKTIEFAGISPEAEQDLRSRLTIHEGDVVSKQDIAAVTTAVRAYDSHLAAVFTLTGASDSPTALRIFPSGTLTAAGRPGLTYTTQAGVPAPLVAGPPSTGAYRPGGDVSNPVPISRPEPQYSEEARKAKWGGTVLLSLVVDENGKTQNIHVVKPLGLGLDEQAILAVTQWTFRPGMKSGVAVPVQAQIEVTFRPQDADGTGTAP